ncbi:hypothetical protein EV421DRAFT_1915826 [Armillaria borealis]|uniref:Uncharacterized protein n=1 Tax=Armillaria borealis TaxID=47425 RepID=A0AA39IC40_9AGAR|nr:hypothetical protein EV421DRAFT_1915826 [Armillaria borealis]
MFQHNPDTIDDDDDANWITLKDVVQGHESLEISHAGGEWEQLRNAMQPKKLCGWTRSTAVDAYLAYSYHNSEGRGAANYESSEIDGSLRVRIIDFDTNSYQDVPTLSKDKTVVAAMEPSGEEMGEDFVVDAGPARKARVDLREVVGWGDYYISRARVEEFSKDAIGDMLTTDSDPENPMEPSPCAERWSNMVNDLTSRMWGIYDETGIFLSVCRHGFVLLVADMVKSGELAKYPLSMVDKLIDVLGEKLGVGYDVGCKFGTTVNRSPIGPKARAHQYRSLLCNLGTYILGMGLEDLETCERWFSKSNSLASLTRHMSAYHRRIAIIMYMHHVDRNDAYENLSKFLCNNYKQALNTIKEVPALLQTMDVLGIKSESEFEEWRQEEQDYLNGLTKEPEFETSAMDYYTQLVELYALEAELDKNRVENGDLITPGIIFTNT